MATLLDAFALVALALDEPAAAEVEALLRRGDAQVSAVNLGEAIDQLGRVRDHGSGEIAAAFEPLTGDVVVVLAVDEGIAWRAADLRRRHYKRRRSEMSLADCIALASVGDDDVIATADPPLARAARAEGTEVVALPSAAGRRP
jgi:PIN domain nuclease of toxin-antitoxin system